MRTITLHITPDQLEQLHAQCVNDLHQGMITTDSRTTLNHLQERAVDPVSHALSRLLTWALPNDTQTEGTRCYDQVTITCVDTTSPELVAVYTCTAQPTARYVIGAVWHTDHWGFHS